MRLGDLMAATGATETNARKYIDFIDLHLDNIFYDNNLVIISPYFNSNNLNNYIDKKYSAPEYANNSNTFAGLTWAQNTNNIQSYYKVITRQSSDGLGKIIQEKIEVDANTYTNNVTVGTVNVTTADNKTISIVTTKETKTYYDYENDLNESKRTIKLLKKEFVDAVEQEFLRVVNA